MKSYNSKTAKYITIKEFKQIIRDYKIEFIKGQELNEIDFHEWCRQLFSQLCQKPNDNANSFKSGLNSQLNNFGSNKPFSKTMNKPNLINGAKSKSPGMRKQWNKRGTSTGKQSNFLSQSKSPNVRNLNRNSKQPNQKSVQASKETSVINGDNINVVVEEDKLDFDTFKANYNELVTVRKLVQLIQEKVETDTK